MKPIRNGKKCGRNEACLCGSQKKSKKCCKKQTRKIPRRVIVPRALPGDTDFRQIAGSEAVEDVTRLLVNNNLPGPLVYLFYHTGSVFSEYNFQFLSEEAAARGVRILSQWQAMTEEEQSTWYYQWKEQKDGDEHNAD
jgi:hypothetical protein